jgi:MFS family permease
MLYTRSFILMALANLFTVSSFGCFFLFPLFISDHGGSEADIGIIMSTFALAAVLCRPWISDMIDTLGRKRSYTVGTLVMTLLPLAYLPLKGDIKSFYLPLLLIRLIHGAGLAICFTAAFTYVADIIPVRRLNEGIGMFGVTSLAGMAVGPVMAEAVIHQAGFPAFFLSVSASAALGLFLHLPLPESYVPDRRGERSPSFYSILFGRRILTITLLALLFGVGLAASGSFVAPFAKSRQMAFISFYFIAYSSAAVLTRLFGGRLADRVGESRIVPYALAITGTGLLVLIFHGGTPLLIFSGLMSGCGHGLLFPSLNALAIRNAPIHIRGKINGIFTGGIDAGALIGGVTLGYIGEWASFTMLFATAGFAVLSGLVIYGLQTRRSLFRT